MTGGEGTMKLGFIGCGNMAQAMITGILKQNVVSPDELIVSNPHEEKTAKLKEQFGILTTTDNKKTAKEAEIVVLAVKPQVYPEVIKEIRDEVSDHRNDCCRSIHGGNRTPVWKRNEDCACNAKYASTCRRRNVWIML